MLERRFGIPFDEDFPQILHGRVHGRRSQCFMVSQCFLSHGIAQNLKVGGLVRPGKTLAGRESYVLKDMGLDEAVGHFIDDLEGLFCQWLRKWRRYFLDKRRDKEKCQPCFRGNGSIFLSMNRHTFLLAVTVLGAAATAQAAPVPPVLTGTTYVFTFPDNGPRMVVDPAPGGRIVSLKLGTPEFLYLSTANNNLLWGSVFWTAPQSDWNWPPPAAHNLNAYTGGPQGDVLVLAGGQDNASRFSMVKRFSGESSDTSISLTYTIKNGGTAARSAAPWAITRVLPGGLTFWSKGPGSMRGNHATLVKEQGGWVWFDHAAGSGVSGNIP